MEGSVIKFPAQHLNMDEIRSEDNPRAKTIADLEPQLADTLSISVDYKDRINQNIENRNASNKEDQSENQDIERFVEGSKNPDKFSSIIITDSEMTKPSRSRISSKKENAQTILDDKKSEKMILAKNVTRKVLGEQQQIQSLLNCNSPGIFLRSKRKRSTEVLSKNLTNPNTAISNENEVNEASENRTDIEKKNGKESPAEDDALKESEESLNPSNVASEKQNTDSVKLRKITPCKSLSLMDKILIREHEMLETISNRVQLTHQTENDAVVNNVEKNLADGSSNPIRNDIAAKKKFHRRKSSEPFKNEQVQTRQSRNIMSIQSKNAYKYFPQDLKPVKYIPVEPDGELVEKMSVDLDTIICTPDISVNDQAIEITSDENQNLIVGSVDKESEEESGCNEDQHASNVAKKSFTDEISCPLSSKNNSESISTNSKVFAEEISSVAKQPQLSKKRGPENADENPKRKLRHVNAQTMPVYTGKISVTKNDKKSLSTGSKSLLLSRIRNNGNKSSDTEHRKAEERRENSVIIEEETHHFSHSMSLRSKTDKSMESKFIYLSNTDSEDTLSNVESVPNSPAQETRPKLPGKNLKLGNKWVKQNSVQSSSSRTEPSLNMNRISVDGVLNSTENDYNTELTPTDKSKCSRNEISSTLNCSTNRDGSKLRFYVETSATLSPSCVSDGTDQNVENDVDNDDLREPKKTPWLRYYERPNKASANAVKNFTVSKDKRRENSLQQNQNYHIQQEKDGEIIKKTSYRSVADDTPSDNVHHAKEFTPKNRSGKLPQPVSHPPPKKRGRPRKQDAPKPEINSKGNKKKGRASSRTSLNGSGLTKLELERLFFKFLQDGHFRVVPGKPSIIIQSNDLYQKHSARMQCYDPRRNYPHSYNAETDSNTENDTYSQQHFQAYNDTSTLYPSNGSISAELRCRPRTINPNSHKFSNEFVGQTTYSRNQTPCTNTHVNTHSYPYSENPVMNNSSFNASNYLQPSNSSASNHHQNLCNNNANVVGNNTYFDSQSANNSVNSNGFIDNTNASATAASLLTTNNNFEDDLNFIFNQHQQSIPCREIDPTISNGNTVSSNSVSSTQNSSTNNVNLDWNPSGTNQNQNSTDGLLMDLNFINNTNESNQPIDGSLDLNNVMSNANSAMNVQNPWMNRWNHMINPQFPVLPPWHTSLPMYNSHSNNGNAHYNNIFNPYTAFMGFDHMNGYTSTSIVSMGMNNAGPWMGNTIPGGNGFSTFNSTSTEFSNMNSSSQQENTSDQGMNVSLSSESNVIAQTNSIKLDSTDINMEHGNSFVTNIEEMKVNTFEQIEVDNNKDMRESYGEQTYLPYSGGYRNDRQNLDFDNIKMSDVEDDKTNSQPQQSLAQIEDYINQRSNSLKSCHNQNYEQSGPPSCEVITDPPQDRQTEMSKLRQELADFTRQYSEDQISPLSQFSDRDEIFI